MKNREKDTREAPSTNTPKPKVPGSEEPIKICSNCKHKNVHEDDRPCVLCSRNPFKNTDDYWEPDNELV